jgi:hypothetical protein
MTSAQMRSAVESVKRKESRHVLRPGQKPVKRLPAGSSAYEEGVQIAKSAVELYRKALKKIK